MSNRNSNATVYRPSVTEVKAKGIILKSKLPKAPYVANPYTGCQMGCLYCYAAFMKKWSGHVDDTWGTFVDVKVNAPELVAKQQHGGKDILFSSVTDAYQPLEGKYKITRRVLEQLVDQDPQPSIGILTKSFLVTRDIDLLQRFNKCTVGFSFCTLDDKVRHIIEPITPIISQRVAAVQKIHSAGIRTYVFLSPIMPYLTNIEEIVDTFREHVDFFMFENLNVRGYLWPLLKSGLEKLDPTLIPRYEDIYFGKEGRPSYWNPIEARIRQMTKDQGLHADIFFHHGSESPRAEAAE